MLIKIKVYQNWSNFLILFSKMIKESCIFINLGTVDLMPTWMFSSKHFHMSVVWLMQTALLM